MGLGKSPERWHSHNHSPAFGSLSFQLSHFLCGFWLNPQLLKEIILLLDMINIPGMLNILGMLLVMVDYGSGDWAERGWQGRIKPLGTACGSSSSFAIPWTQHPYFFLKLECKGLVGISSLWICSFWGKNKAVFKKWGGFDSLAPCVFIRKWSRNSGLFLYFFVPSFPQFPLLDREYFNISHFREQLRTFW